jgi:hypothetical protein
MFGWSWRVPSCQELIGNLAELFDFVEIEVVQPNYGYELEDFRSLTVE